MLRRFVVVSPPSTSASRHLAAPTLIAWTRHLQAGSSSDAKTAVAPPSASSSNTELQNTEPAPTADVVVNKTGAELLRQQADERRALERARREELSGSVSLPRNTKVSDDRITAAARDKVSKITVTASHVVQQSGTWQTRGDVIGVSEAGVPIVHRDPDVAVPETYATPADLTETYFELPEGFDQNRFYGEVARENLPMLSLWTIGMLGYWYSWPALLGWPAVLAGTAVVQRMAARFGADSVPRQHVFHDECLRDKICVVTGASSGVGLHTAVDLAVRGAAVICSTHSRSEDEFRAA